MKRYFERALPGAILAMVLGVLSTQTSFAGGFSERYFLNYQTALFAKLSKAEVQQGTHFFDFLLKALGPAAPTSTTDGVVEQRIDPLNASDERTFQQRYFVDDSFANAPDSPVIYYICGESACSGNEFYGAPRDYASQLHAHLVALEHRFYGQSQPFSQLDSQSLKYLSTKYALSDLAAFEDYAKKQWGWGGKWLVMGGSYAGSLSAFYRQQFPQNSVAALASSAPVQPRVNFEQYDFTVHEGAGAECAAAIQSVVAQIEAAISDPVALAQIKKLFQADEIKDPVDFLYVVADMAATAVQYGFKDQFCQTLLKTKDSRTGYLNGYAQAGVAAFASFQMTPIQDSFQSVESTDPANYEKGVGARQWFYQSCTEYGYFQTAFHDPRFSARSSRIDAHYHESLCNRFFGVGPVDISPIQRAYYEPLLDPATHRILFTNGSTDPWANLSVSLSLGNNTNPNTQSFMIEGGSHCSDLGSIDSSNPAPVSQAQSMTSALFQSALKTN